MTATKDPVITERVTFGWRVVGVFIVATATLVSSFLHIQNKYDSMESRVGLLENNAVAISDMRMTLDNILIEQKVQTALQRAKLGDRWTASMEIEEQRTLNRWRMKIHPETDLDDLPDAEEIQRKHLEYIWTEIKEGGYYQ